MAPDPSTADSVYLAHVSETFLDALREAQALSEAGDAGQQLEETLRFASELLDVMADELQGHQAAPAALDHVETLRGMLRKAQGLLGPAMTLH